MSLAKKMRDNKADYKSIQELLTNVQYYVPDYQRSYSWTKVQLDDLFDSIDRQCEVNSKKSPTDWFQNYFGPLLIKPRDGHTDKFEVLDGQQRLTTFIMIIYAINKMIKDEQVENNTGLYAGKERKIDEICRSLEICLQYNPSIGLDAASDVIILHTEKRDRANMSELIFKDKFKYGTNKIAKNYKLIHQRLSEMVNAPYFDKHHTKIDRLNHIATMCLMQSYMLRTELKDVDSAFAIFESLNTTGLQLSPFDLINGYLTEHIGNSLLKEEWKNKVSEYRGLPDMKIDEYVFYWLNSKGESIDKISLYSETKKYIDATGADLVVKEMIDVFDDLYDYLTKEDYPAVFLALFKRKKVIPLYISLRWKNYPIEIINDIMKNIVKYSIIELNLLGKSPGTFQYKVKEILDYIQKNKVDSFTSIKQNIKSIKSDYDSYCKTNPLIVLENGDVRDQYVIKGLLLMIFEGKNGNAILPNFKSLDIEHVLPQSPNEDWFVEKEWKDLKDSEDDLEKYTYMLGNCTLLSSKINRSIKNKFLTKKEDDIIAAQSESYLHNADWNKIDFKIFDRKYIENRTSFLVKMIKEEHILY